MDISTMKKLKISTINYYIVMEYFNRFLDSSKYCNIYYLNNKYTTASQLRENPYPALSKCELEFLQYMYISVYNRHIYYITINDLKIQHNIKHRNVRYFTDNLKDKSLIKIETFYKWGKCVCEIYYYKNGHVTEKIEITNN